MITPNTLQKTAPSEYRCKGGILVGSTKSYNQSFSLPLHIISMAWYSGCEMEDLADGFGLGLGTNGDWSAIRDSSEKQQTAMLERALNFLEACVVVTTTKKHS